MDKQIPPVGGEEVEVVAWRHSETGRATADAVNVSLWFQECVQPLMTVAQHQRIVEALLEDARYNYQLALDWQDKVIELQSEREQLRAEVERLTTDLEAANSMLIETSKAGIELRAQLAQQQVPVQAEPASPWVRVVDQQPKKGEDVLVWCHDTNEQFVAFSLGDGRFQFGIGQDGTILVCRPNYWQPLPKAPYQP